MLLRGARGRGRHPLRELIHVEDRAGFNPLLVQWAAGDRVGSRPVDLSLLEGLHLGHWPSDMLANAGDRLANGRPLAGVAAQLGSGIERVVGVETEVRQAALDRPL